MNNKATGTVVALQILIAVILLAVGTMIPDGVTRAQEPAPLKAVPAEYADKQMPEGWWTDPKIIKEGEEIYMGRKYGENVPEDKRVFCVVCHGPDGKPALEGVPGLDKADRMNRLSDGYWFWRIAEGVPDTLMLAWKDKLSEEDIWKVIAFEHQFSHGGKAEEHKHP
jgi:mono/diheme cytochrome c family protein